MALIANHIRVTNSGRVPELFLTAKVQTSQERGQANRGTLYFVLQINAPWTTAQSFGNSLINIITRDFFKQEAGEPLTNFERALAKANQLIEQIRKDNPRQQMTLEALVALSINDDFHLASLGRAEAYFWRHNELSPINDTGYAPDEAADTLVKPNANQKLFANLMSGEITANDRVLLGSPALFALFQTDELNRLLAEPLDQTAKSIARRAKSLKKRNLAAIVIEFESKTALENRPLIQQRDTIYLDQPIDSGFSLVTYYWQLFWQPLLEGGRFLTKLIAPKLSQFSQHGSRFVEEKILPVASQTVKQVGQSVTQILPKTSQSTATPAEPHIPIRSYLDRQKRGPLGQLWRVSRNLYFNLLRQLWRLYRRAPRTWYLIASLLILSAIGYSIQSKRALVQSSTPGQKLSQTQLQNEFKAFQTAENAGELQSARLKLLTVIVHANQAKDNPKLRNEATTLLGEARRQFERLGQASWIDLDQPLLMLDQKAEAAIIHEGFFYFTTAQGEFKRIRLTGGESEKLANQSDSSWRIAHQLDSQTVILADYQDRLAKFDLEKQELTPILTQGALPTSLAIASYNQNIYTLDAAQSELWRLDLTTASPFAINRYLKEVTTWQEPVDLAIDGSIYILQKNGELLQYSRGKKTAFKLTGVPTGLDELTPAKRIIAEENSQTLLIYVDGQADIPPRLLEFDATGRFIHQYLLPSRLSGRLSTLTARLKSHKVYLTFDQELYELTLVQN